MAVITAQNNGSLVEVMKKTLVDLKTKQNFLTSKLDVGGPKGLNVQMANNRGFRVAIDYTRNNSIGYMDANGGTLVQESQPPLDNVTASLQYMQYGQRITNLQLANSAPGMHVGPGAREIAAKKILMRQAEIEEFYFCQGNGYQTFARPTANASTTINVAGAVTLAGTGDGLGAYLLGAGASGVGEKIQVFSSAYAFKHSGYVSAKASNKAIEYTPTVITTTGILTTDLIFPQGEATNPTTAGLKGLPYMIKASGTFYDKSLATVPALQGTIDSTTTTFTRTSMEALWRNLQGRAGKNPNVRQVCSLSQMSNYYTQFYAQNTAQVHVVGNNRPGIDVGANGTPDDYTFWGSPIDSYYFIAPNNWWMLDYSTFTRLTLKQAGSMLTPAGQYVQSVGSSGYINAQSAWDDNYIEFFTDQPFLNGGFTNLSFTGLPGQPCDSAYTGSIA